MYRSRGGVRRHPWVFLWIAFLAYSVLWTFIESFTGIITDFQFEGTGKLLIIVAIAFVIAAIWVAQPREITIPVKGSNTKVNIRYGDLFSSEGHKVIAVSEYFESEIGDLVSRRSVHGTFINETLGGHSETFDELVAKALNGVTHEVVQKDRGKNKKYRIGTTAVIPFNEDKFFLLALTETDIETLKVHADLNVFMQALSGLWKSVRIHAGGCVVNIPLLGSGLSGVGLPPNELLKLIIISLQYESKKLEVASSVRIVLTEDTFKEIDLRQIKKELA